MADPYSEEDQERFDSYRKVHLKKDQLELSITDQIEALQQRDRSKWWHLALNIAALLVFGYSFYYDITQLGSTFFVIITIVFVVNVILIFYQKKQIQKTIDYLHWKSEQE